MNIFILSELEHLIINGTINIVWLVVFHLLNINPVRTVAPIAFKMLTANDCNTKALLYIYILEYSIREP